MNNLFSERAFAYPDKLSLFHAPTPVVHLKRMTQKYGNGVDIYMKRDDLTGMELSGNKIRKLEFLLADAIKNNCTTVMTCGGIQSNHCRATAAACAKLGLKCILLLRTSTPKKPYDGNLLLDDLFGADIRFIPRDEYILNKESIFKEIAEEENAKGNKVYHFDTGGSVPLGCWGYVKCLEEIIKDEENLGVEFNHTLCALGSGGTYAGLVLGKALFEKDNMNIWGVNVCDDEDYFRREITGLLDGVNGMFDLSLDVNKIDINIVDGYVGEGYSIPYEEEIEIIKDMARLEGIVLDPVYTGKAFFGMLEQIKEGIFKKGERVLFIHSGGLFGLFPLGGSF